MVISFSENEGRFEILDAAVASCSGILGPAPEVASRGLRYSPCLGEIEDRSSGLVVLIEDLEVVERSRGKGLGSGLVLNLLSRFEDRTDSVYVWSLPEAIRFWSGLGWEQVANGLPSGYLLAREL